QAWFAFGGSLLAADTLARSAARVPVLAQAFRRTIAAVLTGLAVASLGVLALTPTRQFESEIPRGAVDAAAAVAARHPGLRVLGGAWCGTPMLWLHPATLGRVGFDIRLEQYSPAQIGAYADFLFARGPGWQRLTAGYGIIAVSRREHPQLAEALGRLAGWRVAYRDRG